MSACCEKSKSCLNTGDDCCNKQLYGWYGAAQRMWQRSQYQVQYSRPVQLTFWTALLLLSIGECTLAWFCVSYFHLAYILSIKRQWLNYINYFPLCLFYLNLKFSCLRSLLFWKEAAFYISELVGSLLSCMPKWIVIYSIILWLSLNPFDYNDCLYIF